MDIPEGIRELYIHSGRPRQWGTALSYAARLMGLDTVVFWVRAVYDWKPERRTLMQLYGARVYPSPSGETAFGRKLLSEDPRHPGSLGIAVSEGLEYTDLGSDRVYCLGSVLNHVLIHQSIIGLEAIKQFQSVDDSPDLVIACWEEGRTSAETRCLFWRGIEKEEKLRVPRGPVGGGP